MEPDDGPIEPKINEMVPSPPQIVAQGVVSESLRVPVRGKGIIV